MENKTKKVSLKKWTPNLMIKIGVSINIIFCALLSIPVVTLPITITAIVLNGLLLVPRVDTKRYYAIWKFIPVVLVLILTLIVGFIVIFSVTSLENVLNGFVDFINTYIIFWTKEQKVSNINITAWLEIFEIVIFTCGASGSTLIILGWYKGREIGVIEVEDKSKDIEKDEEKNTQQ